MVNVCITFYKFEVVTPDEISKGKVMPGYDNVNFHMIFDINMDGKFTRKEIWWMMATQLYHHH